MSLRSSTDSSGSSSRPGQPVTPGFRPQGRDRAAHIGDPWAREGPNDVLSHPGAGLASSSTYSRRSCRAAAAPALRAWHRPARGSRTTRTAPFERATSSAATLGGVVGRVVVDDHDVPAPRGEQQRDAVRKLLGAVASRDDHGRRRCGRRSTRACVRHRNPAALRRPPLPVAPRCDPPRGAAAAAPSAISSRDAARQSSASASGVGSVLAGPRPEAAVRSRLAGRRRPPRRARRVRRLRAAARSAPRRILAPGWRAVRARRRTVRPSRERRAAMRDGARVPLAPRTTVTPPSDPQQPSRSRGRRMSAAKITISTSSGKPAAAQRLELRAEHGAIMRRRARARPPRGASLRWSRPDAATAPRARATGPWLVAVGRCAPAADASPATPPATAGACSDPAGMISMSATARDRGRARRASGSGARMRPGRRRLAAGTVSARTRGITRRRTCRRSCGPRPRRGAPRPRRRIACGPRSDSIKRTADRACLLDAEPPSMCERPAELIRSHSPLILVQTHHRVGEPAWRRRRSARARRSAGQAPRRRSTS